VILAVISMVCAACSNASDSAAATTQASTPPSSSISASTNAPPPAQRTDVLPPTSTAPTATDADSSPTATTTVASTASTMPTSAVAAPAACTASDLTAVAEPLGDSMMSNTKLVVDVTNTGSAPCALADTQPSLAGVDADGNAVPLASDGSAGTYFGAPPPLTGPLAPGETAAVWIGGGQPGVCDPLDATQTWPSMLLGLPDGTTIPFTTDFDTKCGIYGITNFGTSATQ